MKKPPKPEEDFRAWIKKAEGDLKTAEHTLTLKDKCPFDTVCSMLNNVQRSTLKHCSCTDQSISRKRTMLGF